MSAIVNATVQTLYLLGPNDTMVKSTKPVIAVGAVRTGVVKARLHVR
jgi:predicted GTPase